MDYVFISGSAFVNKTMPRLLALASEAHTVVLGPSAPASPAILQAGATTVMSFASAHPDRLEDGLAGLTPQGVYDAGMRVQLSRACPAGAHEATMASCLRVRLRRPHRGPWPSSPAL